jgi:hypothetical protein
MRDIPKIVRVRLNSSAQLGDHAETCHPDADLLSAFAEHSIGNRERAQVMQHLANCGECREVIRFAQPHIESVIVGHHSGPITWLSWPVLRWGTLAAFALLVSVALLTKRHEKTGPKSRISTQVARSDQQITKLPEPKLSSTLESKTPESKNMPAPPAAGKTALQASRRSRAGYSAGSGSAIGSGPNDKLKGAGAFAARPGSKLAAAAPPPNLFERKGDSERKQAEKDSAPTALSETVTVETQAPLIDMADAIPGKAKEPQPKSQGGIAGGSITGLVANSAPYADQAERKQMSLAKMTSIPRWTVSSDGALQRSFNGGATWETVPVEKNVIFRAVSVVGDSVWAGGARGFLYHSSDAGRLWTRIQLSANGSSLTDDIARIDFTDLQHGQLATTTGETWLTTDAGRTWQKK